MRSLRWNHLWNQYPAHTCGCLSSSRSYSIYLIEHAPISSLLPSFLVRVFTMFNKPSGGHGGTVWLWVPARQNLVGPNPGSRNHKGPWLLVPSNCLMLFWTFAQGGGCVVEPSEYGHEQRSHTVQSSSNGARFVLPLPVAEHQHCSDQGIEKWVGEAQKSCSLWQVTTGLS